MGEHKTYSVNGWGGLELIVQCILRAWRKTKQGVGGIRSLWRGWSNLENRDKLHLGCVVKGPLDCRVELLVTRLEVRRAPRLWTETRTAHLDRNWGPESGCFHPEREQSTGPHRIQTSGKRINSGVKASSTRISWELVKNTASPLHWTFWVWGPKIFIFNQPSREF